MTWGFVASWSISYGWQETGVIPVTSEVFRVDQKYNAGKAPYQARLYLLGELGTETLGLFPLQAIAFPAIHASTVFAYRIPQELKDAGFHFRKFAAMHNPGARRYPSDNWVADLFYWIP